MYTPLFKLRIAFTTIKLSRIILPRLKPKINVFHKSNLVYKFNCPCSSVYIGETNRLLELRIFEHRREGPSHIYQHIQNCSLYKSSLTDSYRVQSKESQKRNHFKKHLTILEGNLHNTNARKTFEGLMITLNQPDLNKQVVHRSTTLVCTCLLPSENKQPGG